MAGKKIIKLYIAKIDKKFSIQNDMVLGPWCFNGFDDLLNQYYQKNSYLDPWDNRTFLNKETEKIDCLIEFLVIKYSKYLNKKHSKNFPTNYWRSIIITWIFPTFGFTYEKYHQLILFSKTHADKKFEVEIIDEKSEINFQISKSITDYMNNSNLTAYVMSKMIKDLNLKNISIKKINKLKPNDFFYMHKHEQEPRKGSITNLILRLKKFKRLLIKLMTKRVDLLYDIPASWIFIFNILSFFTKKNNENLFINNKQEYSYQNISKMFDEQYLKLLDFFIIKFLPESLNSNYSVFQNEILKKKYVPKKIRIKLPDYQDEKSLLENAYAYFRGEYIGYSQHGSNYGVHNVYGHSFKHEYSKDFFITWGWKLIHNQKINGFYPNCKFINLPLPNIKKIKINDKKGKILFVCGLRNYYKTLYVGAGSTIKEAINLRSRKIKFLKLLPEHIRNKISYRPRFSDISEDDVKILIEKKLLNKNQIDYVKDYKKSLYNSKIVVLDHYGTSFHYSLAANCPTVAYWDQFPILTSQSTTEFNNLKRVGIIHETAESAANFVNQLDENISKWWYSSKTQSAVTKWCKLNYNTSKYWWFYWIKFLLK